MSSYLDKTGLEHFWQKVKSNFSSIELTDQVASNIDNIEKLQDKISNNIVNVKDYGAVGDGITNDSEAIQTALAISNNVYLPEGVYLLNSPINIDNDYSNFICHGTLLVNNCAAINLTASYSNIQISHITSSILPESEDSNLWNHDGYCWNFENRGHGIVFGNGTTKIVAYNTVKVDHIERIQNGFWFTPDADGIGGYGGVMYNTIKFDYLFADRGIYFNCGDTITYDTDGVTMIHGPWVNGNLFYGGRIRGNHPIYTVKGAGQTDPYGGSVFYYLGLEACYRPMMLQFFQSNRFIELRATISENGIDSTYNNAMTDGVWDLAKIQTIADFKESGVQIYNPFFIVFDEKSWFNDISYTSFFDMKRVLDLPKNSEASIYQYSGNTYRGHLCYWITDTTAKDLGEVGRIYSNIKNTTYYSTVIIPELAAEAALTTSIDCNYCNTTTINSKTYLYVYNSKRGYAIENEIFRFHASGNVNELATQDIFLSLPNKSYGWGGVKTFYIYISEELQNATITIDAGTVIPPEKFSGPGLYRVQYFDISKINWNVTRIDETVSNLKSLIIQGNGSVLNSYDGKQETVINITPENIGAVSTSGGTVNGNLSVAGNLFMTGNASSGTGYINAKSIAIEQNLQVNNGANPTIEFYSSSVNSKTGTVSFTTPSGKASNNLRILQYSRSSTDYSKLDGYEGYELPAVEADIPNVSSSKWYKFLTTKNPVAVDQGGTGATDAATARTKLGITPANIGAISTSGGTITGLLSTTGLKATDYIDVKNMTIQGNFYLSNGNSPKMIFISSLTGSEMGSITYNVTENSTNSRIHFIQYSRSSEDYSRLSKYEVYYLPYASANLNDNQWYPILTAKNAVTIAQGGTGATDAATARTNLGITPANIGAAPTSHASTATTYGAASASNYGHAMASSTTPKANGTAAVGSETAKFARGDHVHPLQTSVSGSAGSVAWTGVSGKPSYYDAKAIKGITRSGTTFTYTCMDGTTGTFTQQDNNTTYSAGNGLSLSSTTFSVSYGTSASALGTSSAGSASTVSRSDHVHALPALTSCTGTLTIAKGGTGLTASPSMLVNLGSTSAANVLQASPRPGITGTLGIGNGGTGATSKSGARTNLGITSGTSLPSSASAGDIFFLYS